MQKSHIPQNVTQKICAPSIRDIYSTSIVKVTKGKGVPWFHGALHGPPLRTNVWKIPRALKCLKVMNIFKMLINVVF